MTICRYFLQGNCRFGDRCRFEHTEPDYSHRQNDHNYQDRYNQHTSYNSGNDSHYDSRYTYRKENYNAPSYNPKRDPYHPDYGNYENKYETQYSARYDDKEYRYSQQKPASGSSYNKSKHEWTSDDSRTARNVSQYNTSTPKSKISFSFKDPDLTPKHSASAKNSVMNEHTVFYAELVRKDAEEWEEGKIWPFSSYSPKMDRCNFPGFYDFSFEEMRLEAYKAEKNNSYVSFVDSVTKKMIEFKNKIKEMKDPTGDFFLILEKYKNGEFPDMEPIDGESFLKWSSTAEEMMSQVPQKTSASTFSFKTTSETDNAVKKSAAAFSFKTLPETVKNSASAFSFKSPLATDAIQSSASAFSFKLPSQPPPVIDAPDEIYTPSEKISLQDREQFHASTFTLGKIPTIPPAQNMCY